MTWIANKRERAEKTSCSLIFVGDAILGLQRGVAAGIFREPGFDCGEVDGQYNVVFGDY